MLVEEVLLYPNQGSSNHQHQTDLAFLQEQISFTEDGTRRLFRIKINGNVTGFVEKRYIGKKLVSEFALGGVSNGVDEKMARDCFIAGIKPVLTKKNLAVDLDVPVLVARPELKAGSKSTVRKSSAQVTPKAVPQSPARQGGVKPMTRREGLALAGNLLKGV